MSLWTPKNPTNGRGSGLPRDGGWRRAVHDLGVGEMYAGASTMRDTDMEKRDVAETAGADVAELREAAVGFLPGTGLPVWTGFQMDADLTADLSLPMQVAEKLEFSMDPIKHPISQLREKRDPDYQVGHGGDVRVCIPVLNAFGGDGR